MYNGVTVLDVHGHVSMPWSSRGFAAFMMASNSAAKSAFSEGGFDPAKEEEYRAEAHRHLDYIEARNIDVQIIGGRPYMALGFMAPHLIPAWTRYVNDVIHQQTQLHPGRFLGACQLPQIADAPDVSHALPELNRCVNDYGFVATYLSPDPTGMRTSPGLDHLYWYPLYERCSELNLPIIVHGTNCRDPRIASIPENYQLGFVIEQYIATETYSHTDVFEHFPDLKVVICHCGGALSRFIRSDRHRSQKDLTKNLFFDTCAHDVDYLSTAIRQRTVPQTLFGSEAPGSGSAKRQPGEGPGISADDLVPVITSFDWLSESDKLDILHNNAVRVFPGLSKDA